jgi:hypothetical protein
MYDMVWSVTWCGACTGSPSGPSLENYFDGKKYICTYKAEEAVALILFLALMTANY